MSRRLLGAMVVCLALLGRTALSAHHSAVLFDLSETVTMSGTMTKVDWRNPHVEIFVEAKREDGKLEIWELETGAPAWFRARNLAKNDLEKVIGQTITVEGVRAKDGAAYGYLYKIVFPDRSSFDLR